MHPDLIAVSDGECRIHLTHSPMPKVLHRHHVIPQSWGGTEGPQITLCPTSHYNVHHLIDEYVRLGEEPPWDFREHYGQYERELAERAWANRPSDHPPYTLHEP